MISAKTLIPVGDQCRVWSLPDLARQRGQDAPPSVLRSGGWVVPTSAKKLGIFADGATLRSALMDDQWCDARRTSTRAPTRATRHALCTGRVPAGGPPHVVGRRVALGPTVL